MALSRPQPDALCSFGRASCFIYLVWQEFTPARLVPRIAGGSRAEPSFFYPCVIWHVPGPENLDMDAWPSDALALRTCRFAADNCISLVGVRSSLVGHHRLLASLVAAGSVGIVVAIFAAGLSFMHYYDARVQVRQDLRAQHLIDIPLPHLALTALNGKPIPVSALQGQITVIDFWGTWCAACIAEFPSLEAAQKEYSGNATVRFLPVNPEIEGDTPEKIERFLQRRPIAVPMALDPGPSYFDLSNKLNNNELPLMLVVDQHGDIRFCEYGFENADKTRRGIRPDINALLVRH
jgi:thiol-disulfide isomerase/thioredoxin